MHADFEWAYLPPSIVSAMKPVHHTILYKDTSSSHNLFLRVIPTNYQDPFDGHYECAAPLTEPYFAVFQNGELLKSTDPDGVASKFLLYKLHGHEGFGTFTESFHSMPAFF